MKVEYELGVNVHIQNSTKKEGKLEIN